MRNDNGLTLPLFLAIALLSTVAPITTDFYLPSFPQLAADFGVSEAGAQLTLTASLLGIGVGQLVLGPLSDRFGRRRPLIVGAAVCCVAGAVAALAPSLVVLVVARFVQGAAGAAGIVIGRAVIADVARGATAARAFSLVMTIGGVAPIVGPVIGGQIAAPLGWRGALGIVFGLTVVMLVVAVAVVGETHPATRRHGAVERTGGASGRAGSLRASQECARESRAQLLSRRFVGNALICGFSFAGLMAYVSAAPFLYQEVIGQTPAQFGLTFGLNALVLVVATFVASRLTHVWAPRSILGLGVLVMLAAATAFAAVVLTALPDVLMALVLPLFLGGFGLAQGNAVAEALLAVPRASGTASAVVGALQYALSGVSTVVVGAGSLGLGVTLALAFAVCLAVVIAGFVVARDRSVSVAFGEV